jgi:hypothetical protein
LADFFKDPLRGAEKLLRGCFFFSTEAGGWTAHSKFALDAQALSAWNFTHKVI